MKMAYGKDDSSFHLLFQSLPSEDKLIEEYTCSYNDGPSVSIGKLYISQNHVSYAPKIGSTQIIIPIREISSISKKNTVYLFPNAIEVVTLKDQRYFFTAFLSRDLAFSTLTTIINAGGGTRTKIYEDLMLGDNSQIKLSSEEISDPNINNEDPFKETPTLSTFQPSKNRDSVQLNPINVDGNNKSPPNAINNNIGNEQAPNGIQDKVTNRQSPSPSNLMFKSAVVVGQANDSNTQIMDSPDSKDDITKERKLSDSIVDNYAENSTGNSLNTSTDIPDQIVNEKEILEIKNEKEQNNSATTTIPKNDSSSSLTKPIPLKESNNFNNASNTNLNVVNNNNNNTGNIVNTPASPLKSSQTINSPPTTSPPQKHHTLPKQQSFTKIGALNISSDQFVQTSNNNLNSSQQLQQQPQQQQQQSQPQQSQQQPQAQTPIVTPESPSVSRLPKFTSFENLPAAGNCDHIIYSDFDEGPWSTEKYNISMQEFYNLIIRGDFWGSVNTTHSYTEQIVSEWKQSENCCISRTMDFKTAISFKIGPKSTRVLQTQRCRLKNKNELVFESSSISRDVPYGDSFSVENLLLVQAVDENSCITKLSSKIKFIKTIWGLSSVIQKSAYQGNKDFFVLWNTMVRNQVETFAFNKYKAKRASAGQPSTPIKTSSSNILPTTATTSAQPIPPQQASQTQEQPTVVSAIKESDSRPSTPTTSLTSSPSILLKEKETQTSSTSLNLGDNGQSIVSSIWSKMNNSEKKYLFIILILLLLSILGLMCMVISTSSTSRSLNQQIYRFSDTLVLLDSKITQLSNGGGAPDASVTYHSDIGKDRLKYLQDRLDVANSLLQRSHSIISSLQGELALENLKSERSDYYQDQSSYSFFSIFIYTFITMFAGFIWYSGYHNTIREMLPF